MAGKFAISKVNTGVKFNLKATNGEVIATSQVSRLSTPARVVLHL